MPAKGTKLSSSKKRARAAKAASTRRKNKIAECKKKCTTSGGAACSSGKKKKRASAKKGEIPKALKPWLNFLAEFRKNTGETGRDAMQSAASEWRMLSAKSKAEYDF